MVKVLKNVVKHNQMWYNVVMEETIYKPKAFGQLIGRSVLTLQRWDRKGILRAYRSPTNRRYYTHQQYVEYLEKGRQEAKVTNDRNDVDEGSHPLPEPNSGLV